MISYKEACSITNFDRYKRAPQPYVVFLATKNNQQEEFASKTEAYQFSNLVEEIVLNQNEIDDFWDEQFSKEIATEKLIISYLRSHYANQLTETQFDKIWSNAYDLAHPNGLDAVVYEFGQLLLTSN